MSTDSPLGIVYDLDDTLYPEEDYVRSGLRTVGRALGAELGVPDLADRLLLCFQQGDRAHIYNRALEELGSSGPDVTRLVERMVQMHRLHTPGIILFPDAEESLQYWRKRAKLGIISDGFLAVQQAKITALGLESRVDAIILTDQRGREYWKPHPWAFEQAAERLKVPHNRCVYVADNPAKDFVAPNALGWTSVCVRRKGGFYANQSPTEGGAPGYSIGDLKELPRVLGIESRSK
jgi:putative hydrolase of the HAD superfamily